jgi:streptogramin lyase
MRWSALPIVILAALTPACSSSGAVGVGTVTNMIPPPKVVPNSVVRINPTTLKPVQVVPVGDDPDLVIDAGGYIWVTHHILTNVGNGSSPANTGNRTVTRVDPSTGTATVVGGGLAPCGLTADPSGDVWVANCFSRKSGETPDIVRVDARTLRFKASWPVPGGHGFFRAVGYGNGSVWLSDDSDPHYNGDTVIRINPRTGAQRSIHIERPAGAFAWSAAHGDMWINNFNAGSMTRLHAKTGASSIIETDASSTDFPAVTGDTVWAGDWFAPQAVRLHITRSPKPRNIALPVHNPSAGVWNIAAGAGYVWATTPSDRALWRIDPHTDAVTRISMPYPPIGVTANASGVWITIRRVAR